MSRISRQFLSFFTTAATAGMLAYPAARSAPTPPVTTEFNAAVLMRDGVVLRAEVMRPETGGPFPTLVYRTPYGKTQAETEHTTFRHAVERGYAVVIQDVRGRYGS